MFRLGRPPYRSAIVVLAMSAIAVFGRSAAAQQYASVPPRVDAKQANAMSGRVAVILRDAPTPLNADDQKLLDDFFTGYYYMAMTSTDPVELGKLQDLRGQLFTRFLNNAKSPAAREYVMANTLKAMTGISKGNFHPAVRYNATLILGQLEGEPGKPLPGATEALISLLQNDSFKDSKGRDIEVQTAVKLGALVGIQRHVSRGVDAKYAEPITKAAIAIATREKAPEDASAKVYGWVRRQAAQVLAAQFAQGLTPETLQVYVQVIADDTNDIDDRCGVAELLTATMFEGKQLDTQKLAQSLGKLAKDVFSYESEEAKDYLDDITAGGGIAPGGGGGYGGGIGRGEGGYGGYGGRGGFEGGMGFGMADDLGPKYEKRRMMDRAKAIVAAATAAGAGSSEQLKGQLTQFASAISAVIETAATEQDVAIASAVEELSANINQMISQWAPAAAPAEDAGEVPAAPAESPATAAAAPAAAAG